MCGICGKINFDKNKKIELNELKLMTDSIIHRGPDDEGFYIDSNVGLGFRRLSIIDLSTGHQPLANEDDSVWVIFNGEIYNFQELRDNLIKQGHSFKTKTDTEVIVHMYEQYGKRCVEFFRGMFAFVIYDSNKKLLFGARDRFGIKPFYYHFSKSSFAFGSEIKSLLKDKEISREINLSALDSFFTYGYTADDLSIYKSIKKLKPAHYLEIDIKKHDLKIEKYWDVNFEPDYSKTEEEWCEEIDDVLSESVKLRLISDVPLGAFLSGGIDSSSVVALMTKYSNSPVKTFSIGFKEQGFNELQYAREIAEKYNTEHHEKIIEPESIDLLPKLVDAYDEPFADSSAIPTYYVSKFAREYVTVALSGDGGDELFAGYNNFPEIRNYKRFNILPDGFNKLFWGKIHDSIPLESKGKGFTYRLSKNKDNVAAYFSLYTQTERRNLYNKDVWNEVNKNLTEKYKENLLHESKSKEFIGKLQELFIHTYLVDDILTKVDRASMQNSLEVRVPILDHKFAELTFKIPAGLKLKGKEKKYIFKKAMKKYLPENILTHKKQGFTIPLNVWFRNDLKEYINDRLLNGSNNLSPYIDKSYLYKLVNGNAKGSRNLTWKIWPLLFLDVWLEKNSNAVNK